MLLPCVSRQVMPGSLLWPCLSMFRVPPCCHQSPPAARLVHLCLSTHDSSSPKPLVSSPVKRLPAGVVCHANIEPCYPTPARCTPCAAPYTGPEAGAAQRTSSTRKTPRSAPWGTFLCTASGPHTCSNPMSICLAVGAHKGVSLTTLACRWCTQGCPLQHWLSWLLRLPAPPACVPRPHRVLDMCVDMCPTTACCVVLT